MQKTTAIMSHVCRAALLCPAFLTIACYTASHRYRSVETGAASQGQLWNATVQVLSQYFPIAKADVEKAIITTGYRKQRGDNLISGVPGLVLKPLNIRQKPYVFRWKAEAKIVAEEGRQLLKLRVMKEREDTRLSELYPARQYEASGRIHEEETIRHTGRNWSNLGRDHELEMKIAREIRMRLQAARTGAATRPAQPK